jgi:hypothetical protein
MNYKQLVIIIAILNKLSHRAEYLSYERVSRAGIVLDPMMIF